MEKLFRIARSNMRKAKGQTAAIVVLLFLAALMLNLWLMLSMDYQANFKRYHDKLNAEHVTVVADDNSDEFHRFISQKLESGTSVSQYHLDDCMHMVGNIPYNGHTVNTDIVVLNKQTALSRPVGRMEMVEEGNLSSGIYLPMLYKTGDCEVGKDIEVSIGSNTLRYTVCGFFNSVMMGSHNCVITQLVLSQDKYDELEQLGYAPGATLCSVRLNDLSESFKYEATVKAEVSEYAPGLRTMSNCYGTVSQSRYISQGICSAVLSTMAFLVLLIAIVVLVSNIINYIQVNMQSLGALKAIGYTSAQLVGVLLLQFLSLTVFTALAGSALSYGVFPVLNRMMIAQTGIPYTVRFLPLPIFLSLLILCGLIALAVWLSARRVQKIEPITALRAGVQTHNFKRNSIPLEKTKVPLNLALALKTTVSGVKHNITVCITALVLSLIVVFSGLMAENMIMDVTPFLNLIVGETADSCINVQAEAEEDFLQAMDADARVEKVYLYNTLTVSHTGGSELMATLCDDFSKVNNQDVVFEGRYPRYGNEIAIAAKYAREKGFRIGQEIEITANGKQQTYLICGFTQVTNNLGRDCLFTREGYEKLGDLSNASYYIDLVKGTDIGAFNEEIKERLAGQVNVTINIHETVSSGSEVYVSLMTAIVTAILVLSVVIIAFVLYLLVRTMLNNKKRDYGIYKALGFTTGQLILQTALSFMPAMILSTLVGTVVGCFTINPLMSLFFSTIGIVKCTFRVPVGFVTLAGIVLILLSFGIACLLSLKVKKIAPRTLLVGE